MEDRRARAEALIRRTLSLGDAALRAAFVAHAGRAWDPGVLARAIDVVCERAEQADPSAREALVAVVDALNGGGMDDVLQRLRERAAGESLLALERLVRAPWRSLAPLPAGAAGPRAPAADDASGLALQERARRERSLTLGERKALARRPDRAAMARLLADSHPDVIHALLRNPALTEDDVVRLAARRPARAEVLAEVARSTRWSHSPRVRVALVMNPSTPQDVAARLAGLLLRPDLDRVARSPGVPAAVRAVCLEHLLRRPPVGPPPETPPVQ